MRRTTSVVFSIFLLALGLVFLIPLSNRGVSFLDVGFDLSSALRIAHGQVPYRDFFSIPAPLLFFAMRVVIGIFGNVVLPQLWLGALVLSLTSLATFWLVRPFVHTAGALVAWLLTLILWGTGVVPGYTQFAGLFAVLCLVLLTRALGSSKYGQTLAIAAGCALSLTFWSKQSWGAFVVIGLTLTLLHSRNLRGYFLQLVIGTLLGSVPFLVYLAAHGALDDFVRVALLHPLFSYRKELYQPIPSLGSQSLSFQNWQVFAYYSGLATVALGLSHIGYRLLRRRRLPAAQALTIFVAGATYLASFERFSPTNLLVLVPLSVAVGAILLTHVTAETRRPATLAVASVFVLFGLASTYNTSAVLGRYYPETLDTGLNAIEVRHQDADAYRFVTEFTKTHPGTFVIGPLTPLYYFLTNRVNPTRSDLWIPGHFAGNDREQLLTAMRNDLDYVLIDEQYWDFDGRPLSNYASDILSVLDQDYKQVGQSELGLVRAFQRERTSDEKAKD